MKETVMGNKNLFSLSVSDLERELLLGADVNAVDGNGDSLLIAASLSGDLEKVKKLLEFQARVNVRGYMERTAFYVAVVENFFDVASVLLSAGANMEIEDAYCRSVLSRVCGSGDFDAVKYLLEKGANPGATDFRKRNCLMRALLSDSDKKERIAEMIIDSGTVDFNERDCYGNNVMDLADEAGTLRIIEILVLEKGMKVPEGYVPESIEEAKKILEGESPKTKRKDRDFSPIEASLHERGAETTLLSKYGQSGQKLIEEMKRKRNRNNRTLNNIKIQR